MLYQNTPENARKHHYWRGFKTASILLVPVIIILLITLQIAINLIIK